MRVHDAFLIKSGHPIFGNETVHEGLFRQTKKYPSPARQEKDISLIIGGTTPS